ncbi:chorismate synthase [Staphylococcus aureus]
MITKPRPGHADLVGGMKYNHRDLRNVLERSSATRNSSSSCSRRLMEGHLQQLDIDIYSRVVL